MTEPKILAVNVSEGGIPKQPVKGARIFTSGVEGDAHNHDKHYRDIQVVCLQDIEALEELNREGYDLKVGTTGENLTVQGLNVNELPIGTLLEFPSGAVIEISKVRQPCYVLDAIDPKLKDDIEGRCGMYAKVIKEGAVQPHDTIQVLQPSV